MKRLTTLTLLLAASTPVLALNYQVLSDKVMVYPTMVAKYNLLEEKSGTHHYLDVRVETDRTQTSADVREVQGMFPDKPVKAYAYSYVEGRLTIPGGTEQALNYWPTNGWALSSPRQLIPAGHLEETKQKIANGGLVTLTVGYWKDSDVEVKLLNEDCTGAEEERAGALWFFDRLKSFEAAVAKLPHPETRDRRQLLKNFMDACVGLDMEGAKSFGELTGNASDWRFRAKDASFTLTETQRENHYIQVTPELVPQLRVIQY